MAESAQPPRQLTSQTPVGRTRLGLLRCGVLGGLAAALLLAMVATRKWPLVGDAALMHYAVFLLRGGAEPYRTVVDVNLPGTFLFEHVAMSLFGENAWGLRLYDWTLLLGICVLCVLLVGPRHRFAGLLAGMLFALMHLQDGVQQQGQRDLLLALLLLGGVVVSRILTHARTKIPFIAGSLGLLFGISLTIKPVLVPAFGVLLLWLMRLPHLRRLLVLLSLLVGLVLPGAVAAGWLQHHGALHDFVTLVHTLMPLHAALGRRPFRFLLTHSVAPAGPLLLLSLPLAWHAFSRQTKVWSGVLLPAAWLAYATQGKGFPYQRYPVLLLVLLGVGLAIDRGMHARPLAWRVLAATGACLALGQGIYAAVRASGFERNTPTVTALTATLQSLGPPDSLAGNVQCLDTFGGCINTLYDLRLRQSTGYLYDCYLFTAPSAAREAYRADFWQAFQQAHPKVVVVTSQNCFSTGQGYDRLNSWPAFAADLQQHYRVVRQWTPTRPVRWFSRPEMPFGFRVLVRRAS